MNQKSFFAWIVALTLSLGFGFGTLGCEDDDSVGDEVEEAVEEAGDEIEEATD